MTKEEELKEELLIMILFKIIMSKLFYFYFSNSLKFEDFFPKKK